MLSWWDRAALTHDVVVIGGGLVGLATALGVRARRPSARIVVLERGVLPSGATTRSAGFACFGGLGELVHDVDAHGLEATVDLVARRAAGLRRLLQLTGEDGAGYQPTGGFELLRPEDAELLDRLPPIDAALRDVFGGPFLIHDDAPLSGFEFDRRAIAHLVRLPHEGALDPGLMMQTLQARCRAADIAVWTGATVERLAPDDLGVDVVCGEVVFRAREVAVCTNAFARDLIPEAPLEPGRGQVLITEPLRVLPFRGVFHLDAGFVYFRTVGDRILVGGGRHLDPAGESTTQEGLHPGIRAHLDEILHSVVLPGRDVAVAHRWSGTMAFGPERAPWVTRVRPHVWAGVRLGGMGIALGASVGDTLAEHIGAALS